MRRGVRLAGWAFWLSTLVLGGISLAFAEATPARIAKPLPVAKKAAANDGAKKSAAKTEPKKDAPKKADPPKADDKPATTKVKRRPLKIEINLDGTFESQATSEIALRCQEWSDLEVLKAVEHGARVRAGDLLVTLDTEKIDRAIADLQRERTLSQLALQDAELQLHTLQQTVPLDLEANDRSKRHNDEDLEHFVRVDRPMTERMLRFFVKMAEQQLANEKEELRQLEKMYKADDLVEETEEIVLKRARNAVERAQFNLERTQSEVDAMLKLSVPRSEESARAGNQRQAIDWKRAQATIPAMLRRAELGVERMRVELGRSDDKLKKLQADRAQLNLKAPVAGVVYYGRCVRGKWSGTESTADRLRRGGRLMNDDVFLTIVEPRPLAIRTTLSEKQLRDVRVGLSGLATPTLLPDVNLTAIVQQVGRVPLGSKEFDCTLSVALDDATQALVPGMTCDVRLVPYQKANALTVPVAAVGSDDADPRKRLVALPGKDGKPATCVVQVGRQTEKYVEILGGLKEGQEILAEFPKDKD